MHISVIGASLVALVCNAGDAGSVPGSRKSPGQGNGNPLQCSFLRNPTTGRLAAYSPWGHKRVRHALVTNPPHSSNSMEELIICWELMVINTLSTTSDDTSLGIPMKRLLPL